jgi:hypothetical protein
VAKDPPVWFVASGGGLWGISVPGLMKFSACGTAVFNDGAILSCSAVARPPRRAPDRCHAACSTLTRPSQGGTNQPGGQRHLFLSTTISGGARRSDLRSARCEQGPRSRSRRAPGSRKQWGQLASARYGAASRPAKSAQRRDASEATRDAPSVDSLRKQPVPNGG